LTYSQKCDGFPDCPDGEDEDDCLVLDSSACDPYDQWTCENGDCISIEKKCDGDSDCNDGSDESDCQEESDYYYDGTEFDPETQEETVNYDTQEKEYEADDEYGWFG